MEKMLFMLEEIQNIKRSKDQELLETEDETLALNRKVEALEQNVEQMYSLLYQETQRGDNAISSPNFHTSSTPAARFTDTFNDETEELQERIFLVSNRSHLQVTFSLLYVSTHIFSPIMPQIYFLLLLAVN